MDENALVQSAQEGDLDAFRQLFEENKQKIFACAYRYAKNSEDAEDILQETFIKAFQSLHQFQVHEENSFSSWLFRIGINASIDLLRKNRKMSYKYFDPDNIENLPSGDVGHNPEHSNHLRDAQEKISQAMNSLTSRQRMIFILRHYQHLSTREIAEYMQCSQGSVKKQLFRAVSTVKDHFKSLITEKSYEMQKI